LITKPIRAPPAISGQTRVTRPVMAIVTFSSGRAGAWARR